MTQSEMHGMPVEACQPYDREMCRALAFCEETVHHTPNDIDPVVKREIDEVGVDDHAVGRGQSFVVA